MATYTIYFDVESNTWRYTSFNPMNAMITAHMHVEGRHEAAQRVHHLNCVGQGTEYANRCDSCGILVNFNRGNTNGGIYCSENCAPLTDSY